VNYLEEQVTRMERAQDGVDPERYSDGLDYTPRMIQILIEHNARLANRLVDNGSPAELIDDKKKWEGRMLLLLERVKKLANGGGRTFARPIAPRDPSTFHPLVPPGAYLQR
jgi:hypothetical protein